MTTASQMMAAKKKAKEKQNIKRNAKQNIGNQRANRNDKAIRHFNQIAFRAELRKGKPCSQDENTTDEIRNLLHYGTLVYQYDTTSITVFEKLIRAMRLVADIYEDDALRGVCRRSEESIDALCDNNESPNQRRVLLRPLLTLCSMAAQYTEFLPARTTDTIAKYSAAVQVCLYSTSYYDRPIQHIESLNAVIEGESLRSQAKKYGIKEPKMREYILDAAWPLFRIAEVFLNVEEPKAIPDLRRPEWREFSNPEKVAEKIRAATQTWLIPFEEATGITLIDYQKLKKTLIRIETMNNT